MQAKLEVMLLDLRARSIPGMAQLDAANITVTVARSAPQSMVGIPADAVIVPSDGSANNVPESAAAASPDNDAASAIGGRSWLITFHNAPHELPLLSLVAPSDDAQFSLHLNDVGDGVVRAEHVLKSNALGGTFTLAAGTGDLSVAQQRTQPLACDADAVTIRAALMALPAIRGPALGVGPLVGDIVVGVRQSGLENGRTIYVAVTEEVPRGASAGSALAIVLEGAGLTSTYAGMVRSDARDARATHSESYTLRSGGALHSQRANVAERAHLGAIARSRIAQGRSPASSAAFASLSVGSAALRALATTAYNTSSLMIAEAWGVASSAAARSDDGARDVVAHRYNASLSIRGASADLNAALKTLSLHPAAHWHGPLTVWTGVSDQGCTGAGGLRTSAASFTVNVASALDAPMLSLVASPGTGTAPRAAVAGVGVGGARLFTIDAEEDIVAQLDQLRVVDVDAGEWQLVTLEVAAEHGAVAWQLGAAGAGPTLSANGSASLAQRVASITASIAEINAALERGALQYRGDANWHGVETLTATTSVADANANATSVASTMAYVFLNVRALNDAPTIAVNAPPGRDILYWTLNDAGTTNASVAGAAPLVVLEDTTVALLGARFADVIVGDVDAAEGVGAVLTTRAAASTAPPLYSGLLTTTVAALNGTLWLDAAAAARVKHVVNVSGVDPAASDSASAEMGRTVIFHATVAATNALLRGALRYRGPAEWSGVDVVLLRVADNRNAGDQPLLVSTNARPGAEGRVATASITVRVAPVADVPTIVVTPIVQPSGESELVLVAYEDAGVALNGSLVVSDGDDAYAMTVKEEACRLNASGAGANGIAGAAHVPGFVNADGSGTGSERKTAADFDADASAATARALTVTITLAHGVLSLERDGVALGLRSVGGDNATVGGKRKTTVLVGSAAAINAALTTAVYTASANWNSQRRGFDTLHAEVRDASGLASSVDLPVRVVAVNDAPVLTLPAASVLLDEVETTDDGESARIRAVYIQPVKEDGELALLNVRVRDVDVADAYGGNNALMLQLVIYAGRGEVSLGAGASRFVASFTAGGGNSETLADGWSIDSAPIWAPTIAFKATVAGMNAALEGLRYRPLPNVWGADVILLEVNDLGNIGAAPVLSRIVWQSSRYATSFDGSVRSVVAASAGGSNFSLSASVAIPVAIAPQNDAPAFVLPAALRAAGIGSFLTVEEDGALQLTGLSVTDADLGDAQLYVGDDYFRAEHATLADDAWTVQRAGSGEGLDADATGLAAVATAGSLEALAVGASGVVVRTRDGVHWEALSTSVAAATFEGTAATLKDVAIAPSTALRASIQSVATGTGSWSDAWAVGTSRASGVVIATSDGGATWTQRATLAATTLEGIAVAFDEERNATVLIAVGSTGIHRSADSGTTWAHVANGTLDSDTFTVALHAVECARGAAGAAATFCVAVGARGATFLSRDGGISWRDVYVADTTASLVDVAIAPSGVATAGHICVHCAATSSIAAPEATVVWAVSAGGVVYKSTDGAATWWEQHRMNATLSAISAANSVAVHAVGAHGSAWSTVDGGVTWARGAPFATNVTTIAGVAVARGDPNTVWAVDSSGAVRALTSVTVTITAAHGVVSLAAIGTAASVAPISILEGSAAGDANIRVRATSRSLASLNAALSRAVYRPARDFNTQHTPTLEKITLRATDSAGAAAAWDALSPASDGADGATTIEVRVLPINDAPLLRVPGAVMTYVYDGEIAVQSIAALRVAEDVTLHLGKAAWGLVLEDVDSSDDPEGDAEYGEATLTVTTLHGAVGYADGISHIGGVWSQQSQRATAIGGGASLTLRGTIAHLNAAADALVYRPLADWSGADVMTLRLDDGGNAGALSALPARRAAVRGASELQCIRIDAKAMIAAGHIADVAAVGTASALHGTFTLSLHATATTQSAAGALLTAAGEARVANNGARSSAVNSPLHNASSYYAHAVLNATSARLSVHATAAEVGAAVTAQLHALSALASNRADAFADSLAVLELERWADALAASPPLVTEQHMHPHTLQWCITFPAVLGDVPLLEIALGGSAGVGATLQHIDLLDAEVYVAAEGRAPDGSGASGGDGEGNGHHVTNNLWAEAVVAIAVTPVNDAPVWRTPRVLDGSAAIDASAILSLNEDGTSRIHGIAIDDVDASALEISRTVTTDGAELDGSAVGVDAIDAPAGGLMEVRLAVAHGSLTIDSGAIALDMQFYDPARTPTTKGATADGALEAAAANGQAALLFRATLENINRALAALVYAPDADWASQAGAATLTNGGAFDVLALSANDLGNRGAGGARSSSANVNLALVHGVNDPPVITVAGATRRAKTDAGGCDDSPLLGDGSTTPTAPHNRCGTLLSVATIDAVEDVALLVVGVSVDDPDLHERDGGAMKLTIRAEHGRLAFDAGTMAAVSSTSADSFARSQIGAGLAVLAPPAAVTASTRNGQVRAAALLALASLHGDAATLVVRGTLPALNAALASLTYKAPPNWHGRDRITIVADDEGWTGDGGAMVDTATIPVEVAARNDAPRWIGCPSTTITTLEDTMLFGLVERAADGRPLAHALSVFDLDEASGFDGSQRVVVSIVATHGLVSVGGSADGVDTWANRLNFTAGGPHERRGDGANARAPEVVFEGLIRDTNAALAAIEFQPHLNWNNAVKNESRYAGDARYGAGTVAGAQRATVTLRVTDDSGEGDACVVVVRVAPRNDAPAWVALPGQLDGGAPPSLWTTERLTADGESAPLVGATRLVVEEDQVLHVCCPAPRVRDIELLNGEGGAHATLSVSASALHGSVRVGSANNISASLVANGWDASSYAGRAALDTLARFTLGSSRGAWGRSVAFDASLAGANALLRSLSYVGDADWNGNDTITLRVTDAGGLTESRAIDVTVLAVNDAPVIVLPSIANEATRVTLAEEASLVISGATHFVTGRAAGPAARHGHELWATQVQQPMYDTGSFGFARYHDAASATTAGTSLHDSARGGSPWLWRNRLVADAHSGSLSSSPAWLVPYPRSPSTADVAAVFSSAGTAAQSVSILSAPVRYGSASWKTALGRAWDRLYFSADDGVHGRELWRSDGTENGTERVHDLLPGVKGSDPQWVTPVPRPIAAVHPVTVSVGLSADVVPQLFFSADGVDTTWRETSDACAGFRGATAHPKTVRLAVASDTTWHRDHDYECPMGHHWASTAEWLALKWGGPDAPADAMTYWGQCGWDRYFIDAATGSGKTAFDASARRAFRFADSQQLGTLKEAGTVESAALIYDDYGTANFAGIVCFVDEPEYTTSAAYVPRNETSAGRELWTSDGTRAWRVKDIRRGSAASSPRYLTEMGGRVYFSAHDGATGRELWRSDGTPGGTVQVAELRRGSVGSNPRELTALPAFDGGGASVVPSVLVFAANDGVRGDELWRSDGTPDAKGGEGEAGSVASNLGTQLILDIASGGASSRPSDLTPCVRWATTRRAGLMCYP
jgi:ELWxxDGT repeat protein